MNPTIARAALRLLVVAVATVSAACGDDAGTAVNPASPSSVRVSNTGGAVITGRVDSVSASAPAVMATDRLSPLRVSAMATTNIKVTVVGTSVTSEVDGAGQFTLTGVPPGTVQLRFTAPGSEATVTLAGVEADDRIELNVTLNGNGARVTSDRRSKSSNGNEVVGTVTSINAAGRSFQVGGQSVVVPVTAVIRHGNRSLSFADLKVGDHVQVKGTRVNGTVTATEVKVEERDDEDDDDEDDERDGNMQELSGTVSGLGGSCPSITFTVRNTNVRTNGATVFRDACSRILNTARVEVRGTREANGGLLATRVELDD